MDKLNVTEGEWSVDVYEDGDNYIYSNNFLMATVYDQPNDAILMSQSKKLYEQLEHINHLIFTCKSEIELADAVTRNAHDIEYLLAQCQGEQHTCKS